MEAGTRLGVALRIGAPVAIALGFWLSAGCGGDRGDSPDRVMDVGVVRGGKADGSDFSACELGKVVEHLNGGVSVDALKSQGVHDRAAEELVAHRDGPDGDFGTRDDDLYDHIVEVDDVAYVGPVAMQQLVAIVEDQCLPMVVSCPDAPALGVEGTTSVDVFDIPWFYEDGWSVADPVTVQVPTDLEGLIVAVVDGEAETGFGYVEYDGVPIVDLYYADPNLEAIIPPFFHSPVPAGALGFPIDEDSGLDRGCLTVEPVALQDLSGGFGSLYFVSRRRPRGGAIDVNAVIVGTTDISVDEVDRVFGIARGLYEAAGPLSFGTVEQVALDWPDIFIETEGTEVNQLRAAFVDDDPFTLNVYFVQDFLEVGTLGFAAGIPGPNGVQGTASSGLIISVDSHILEDGTLDEVTMGETIAHEVGHQLGLFHTTEVDGYEHDALDDTPECALEVADADFDGEVTAEECVDAGGDNLMFWTSGDIRQTVLTPTQVDILSASPVVR